MLPSWAPDRKEIAFSSLFDGIFVGCSDGRGLRRVVKFNKGLEFSWAPYGSSLAFTRYRATAPTPTPFAPMVAGYGA